MNRAERYKRNYRIVKNKYHDTKLAKRVQSWSDERLYNELGVKVGGKHTPDLKPTTPSQKVRARRELGKLNYALDLGMNIEDAKKVVKYKKSKIESTHVYLSTFSKKLTNKNKIKRMDLWSDWSRGRGDMPPDIERKAREVNRSTVVGGRFLDDYDKYGYIVAFYTHVEGLDRDEIDALVRPDPHDSYSVIYATTTRV